MSQRNPFLLVMALGSLSLACADGGTEPWEPNSGRADCAACPTDTIAEPVEAKLLRGVINPTDSSFWSEQEFAKRDLAGDALAVFKAEATPARHLRAESWLQCRTHGETQDVLLEYYPVPQPADRAPAIPLDRYYPSLHLLPALPGHLLRTLGSDAAAPRLEQRFLARRATIYAAGIRNPGLGDDPTRIPMSLLCRTVGWANAAVPGDERDRAALPASEYVQIVHNDNGLWQGVRGNPDAGAVGEFVANLIFAFESGVEDLEVITHSNGVVTAHWAYRRFIERLNSDAGANMRARRPEGAREFRIYFRHLQPKPSSADGLMPLDAALLEVAGVVPSFTFYFNAADGLTWRDRRVTRRWLRSVRELGVAVTQQVLASRTAFSEYDASLYANAPGAHDQEGVMEWFSDPSYSDLWVEDSETPDEPDLDDESAIP